MQIPSRLTMALHIFACMDTFQDTHKLTSEFLAASLNVNPVVVRRLLSQLKAAGLVDIRRGSGGCTPARDLDQITMLDVYQAVECVPGDSLFRFHENPSPDCPVGRNIHSALDPRLDQVQKAMEAEMRKITLDQVAEEIRSCIQKEGHAQ